MKDHKPPRTAPAPMVIGWMELVDLPLLGLDRVKAKIDTGARTSALHATDIEPFEKDGEPWVRFRTLISDGLPEKVIETPYHSERAIKNTSGVPEDRYIIHTQMRLGKRRWAIDLSITDRTNMTFPMIVGRAALKNHNIVVHTRRTYLMTSSPPKPSRKDSR
ncbi:RimK/LysX family protein [Thalassococcus sp. CAU 1522]|uniref:RimK/LysX family protein n=1 Tax=Thalassococcus arenae TaxID=2851652 RepID=A0ABS6N3P5_9RHOB|nr:RimK/LysX family protein [Thalassococcus arenae]MBV2358645.1 RimK/LysX family protein [Thalassococcus arenae]